MLFSFYCHGAQSCLLLLKQQMSFDFSSLNASLIPPPGFCLFSLPALWCPSWRMRGFPPVALQLQGISVPNSILYPKIKYYSPIHADKSMPSKYWSCKYSTVEITTGWVLVVLYPLPITTLQLKTFDQFFCCKNPNQTSTLGFLWNFLNPPGLMCSWREPQSLLESRCVVIEPDIIERHQICASYLGNWRWPNRGGGENVNEGQTGQSLYRQNFMALNGSFHCLRGTSGQFYAIRSLDTWYFTHRAEVPSSCIMQGQTVCMEEVQESPQLSPQP